MKPFNLFCDVLVVLIVGSLSCARIAAATRRFDPDSFTLGILIGIVISFLLAIIALVPGGACR